MVILRHAFTPLSNTRLAHLCGPMDEHLRTIEGGLQVAISHRQEQFKIDGAKKHAERALAVLQALYEIAARPIRADTVQLMLAGDERTGLEAADGSRLLSTRRADLKARTPNQSVVIGALLAAGVCGPVGGGIIADQAGFRATFLLGAVLALGSGLSVSLLLLRGRSAARPAGAAPRPAMGSALPLFRDFRFSALMVLSAIPTKIASTAFLFCLVPLLLTADGATKAEIGRVQMMYFVAFILVSPLAASLSDRWQARRGFIAAGGIGTLASCLPIVATQALWGPPLAIALFGLSQALVGAPQLTLVSQIAREGGLQETATIGWYRLIERLGGALGPVTAMAVAVATSYREAMLGIGLLCGASALLFWILFRTGRPATPATRPQEA